MALILGGVASGFALWHFVLSPEAIRRRLLRRAPRVTIAEAAEGQVAKLVGTIDLAGERPLRAPISKRPCALWQVVVSERSNNNKRTVLEDQEHLTSFWITDATGRALVVCGKPELVVEDDQHFSSGTFDPASPRMEQLLARHGQSAEGWVFNRSLSYAEGVLEEGETVAVLARCSREPDPDPRADHGAGGFRTQAKRLVLRAPPQQAMLLSDDPSLLDG